MTNEELEDLQNENERSIKEMHENYDSGKEAHNSVVNYQYKCITELTKALEDAIADKPAWKIRANGLLKRMK